MLWLCLTHLKQTLRQPESDLRPQVGAKEEQGDFGHGNARVIHESPFGELQAAATTVSPGAQDNAGGFGDEVQVSRHGLHLCRPGVPAETGHRGAALGGQTRGEKSKGGGKKLTPTEGLGREAESQTVWLIRQLASSPRSDRTSLSNPLTPQ